MLTDNLTIPFILVVENEANHAELILRCIDDAAEEYRVEIAGSLQDARKAIEKRVPSLVLTDYRLPDGDASELVPMVNDACPVIVMTSYGNEEVAVRAMKIGAHDYIIKSPETFERLPQTIKYALMSWSFITARRYSANAILRAKKDWERTFDAVPDLIAIIDNNHTITRINRAMAERCGLAADQIVGRKCYELVHGLQNVACCCPTIEMLQDGLVHSSEVEEKYLNGIFDVTVSPIVGDDGTVTSYVHIMRDITERKNAEEERQNLLLQLHQAQKLESLGVLSGGIAHDFNNILTIILGNCYVLKENIASEEERKIYLQMIESAGNRAADLCRQMLAYAGNSPLLMHEFNLWLLVNENVKLLTAAFNKNVTIRLDMNSSISMIVGDSSQIQQVIMNLVINANEAIGDNKGTINIVLKKVKIQEIQNEIDYFGSLILPGIYACLEVSDSGCGMSEETQRRIFEPFYTTKFTGRGLGMSAILGIIKAHNGALKLTSSAGIGTTFKVYLHLSVSPQQR